MDDTAHQLFLSEAAIESIAWVPSGTTLQSAAHLIERGRLGVIALDRDHSVALVTERDVVRAVAAGVPPETPVDDVELQPAVVASPSTTLPGALRAMLDAGVRSVVVVDDELHPLGAVTLATVVGALLGGPPWLGALRLALHIEHRVVE